MYIDKYNDGQNKGREWYNYSSFRRNIRIQISEGNCKILLEVNIRHAICKTKTQQLFFG